jgi:hypothetical protein
MMGENTVSLEKAQVDRMEVDIRNASRKICPRAPVQMLVTVDARLDGQSASTRIETWAGDQKVRRNGKLGFENFVFTSPQGSVDEFGWFQPNPDVLVSLASGFAITTALKYQPERFTAAKTYDPEYSCVTTGGGAGRPGSSGSSGAVGFDGAEGRSGLPGNPGVPGGTGNPGQPGEPGPRVQAYATLVKTRLYDRLIAIRLEGSVRDLLLAPADGTVTLLARGGDGGPGGTGGTGGDGGRGGRGIPGRSGGSGGPGGPGGNGGNGGPGGSIELVFDSRFPDLGRQIILDLTGGAGAPPGPGGSGGSGGPGGYGREGSAGGSPGPIGPTGPSGVQGQPGAPGSGRAAPGRVSDRFRGLSGIQPL